VARSWRKACQIIFNSISALTMLNVGVSGSMLSLIALKAEAPLRFSTTAAGLERAAGRANQATSRAFALAPATTSTLTDR
jgi:hypothetical protein